MSVRPMSWHDVAPDSFELDSPELGVDATLEPEHDSTEEDAVRTGVSGVTRAEAQASQDESILPAPASGGESSDAVDIVTDEALGGQDRGVTTARPVNNLSPPSPSTAW